MQTLRKLFLKEPLKLWRNLIIALFCLPAIALLLFELKLSFINQDFILSLSFLIIVFGPITLFYYSPFIKNLKFLINNHYNRAQLLKYFVFETILRSTAIVISWFACYLGVQFVALFVKKNPLPTLFDLDLGEIFTMESISKGYALIILLGFISFITPLFIANKDMAQTKKSQKAPTKKILLVTFAVIIILSLIIKVLFYLQSTYLHIIMFSFFITFASLNTINNAFKFMVTNKFNKIAFSISGVFILPYVVFYFTVISQIHNANHSIATRTSAANFLGNLHTNYTNDELKLFLKVDDPFEFKNHLELHPKSFTFDEILAEINSKNKFKFFLVTYTGEDYEEIRKSHISDPLDILEKLVITKNKYNFPSATQYIKNYLSKVELSEKQIITLIESQNELKQILAFAIAHRSLEKNQVRNLYLKYKDHLSMSVTEDLAVKNVVREIASEKEEKD